MLLISLSHAIHLLTEIKILIKTCLALPIFAKPEANSKTLPKEELRAPWQYFSPFPYSEVIRRNWEAC